MFQVFPVSAGDDRKRLLWFVSFLLFQVKGGIVAGARSGPAKT